MSIVGRAKSAARRKSRQVFNTNKKKPKMQVVRKFSNFVGKSTFNSVLKGKKKSRRYRKGRKYRR